MTVQQELERLKKQKEDLEKEKSKKAKELEELIGKRNSLENKRKELEGRISTLAQKLQYENGLDLSLTEKNISKKEKFLRALEAELQKIQTEIDIRQNDTALYIQEQVSLMVPQLLEWIARNKETIGYDIKRSFRVAGVTRREEGRYSGYDYPIGNMGIFEANQKNNEVPIVCSDNFYFKQPCYETKQAEYDSVDINLTDWYVQYEKDFIAAFLKKLEESYNLGEELKLTIKSPEFTLELV